MMTLEEKNELAFKRAEYCDTPALTFDLLQLYETDPDWRMKSLVGYHLMRKFLDDDTFMPKAEFQMDNVQRPFSGMYWRLPYCAIFPAYHVNMYSFVDCKSDCADGFLINLCSFVEESPIIGFRYACDCVVSGTKIIKGLVPYINQYVQESYPGWEFFQVDKSLTDDMTALFVIDFAHVYRVEIAHYTKDDRCLHRIYTSN